MTLAQAKIAHLAKLTALKGNDALHIDGIVDSFEKMQSVDTSHGEKKKTESMTLRQDTSNADAHDDLLLKQTHHKVMARQIVLPSIMHGE